ncbi:MAG: NAD(P)H-dependent oxidoreductase [Anaerolineae bacterium]
MNVFIIYAHPEPMSFDHRLKIHAVETLKQQGHAVQVSDLYDMRFKAVVDTQDFMAPADDTYFNLRTEQLNASLNRTFSEDIIEEQAKIIWAEMLIFQFPLWWYSFPAIMKGWVDRVLTYGFAYGMGRSLNRKRAMLVITTGGPVRTFTPELQESVSAMLDHIQRGVLHVCGISVLPPFAVYGASSTSNEQKERILVQYTQVLTVLDRIAPLEF